MKKKYLKKIHIFRTKTKINDDLILKRKIIDDLRLIYNNMKKNNGISKNNKPIRWYNESTI